MLNSICYVELQIRDYTKKLLLLKWELSVIEDCYNEGKINTKYLKNYKKEAKTRREKLEDQLDRCYIEIQRIKDNNPFSKKER